MFRNRNHCLEEMLKKYDRIAIVGGPSCGKTTLARRVKDRPVVHSDDYMNLEWSEASRKLAEDVNAKPGKLVVEGVATVRAIRKGMKVDAVLVCLQPLREQTKGQQSMHAGVITVLADVHKMFPKLPMQQAPFLAPSDRDDNQEE